MQERDLELLRQLAVMRVADREQVRVTAGFKSTTRVNTRLLALTRARLLRRFFLGSGGGRKAIYSLASKGAQLIRVPCRGPRRRQDETLVADFSIQHQLTINSVYCTLKFASIPSPGVEFVNWQTFGEPMAPSIPLIPDGYAEFKTSTGIDSSFVEVDLGHEVLPVWKAKVQRYVQLATSGEFPRRFHETRFRVLVLTDSERRLQSLRKVTAAITPKIFWFATLACLTVDRLFAPVWLRPVGQTPQPLFEPSR